MDDVESYPLVWLDGNSRRFVLPYQYEFETAASVPEGFADWVVVKPTAGRDAMLAKYPRAARGDLAGFVQALETPSYLVLKREPGRAPSRTPTRRARANPGGENAVQPVGGRGS